MGRYHLLVPFLDPCVLEGEVLRISFTGGRVFVIKRLEQSRWNLLGFRSSKGLSRSPLKSPKKLSIRYVWIDSLCIIQDLAEDWRLESSRMGDVYRHSFCNISASKNTLKEEGLFAPRDPSCLRFVVGETEWSDDGSSGPNYLDKPGFDPKACPITG